MVELLRSMVSEYLCQHFSACICKFEFAKFLNGRAALQLGVGTASKQLETLPRMHIGYGYPLKQITNITETKTANTRCPVVLWITYAFEQTVTKVYMNLW